MKGMFDGVRAFLFDFDGTLVQPSIAFAMMHESVRDVALRFGVVGEPYGQVHTLELIERVGEELARKDPVEQKAFLEEAHRAVTDIEVEAAERVEAYPGAPELLQELQTRGYRVGIVTRNCRAAVERILPRIPLYHDVFLTRDDVSHVKPDPRHLLMALEVLSTSPQQTAMCGDHPMDVVAGRRIGARTVGVLRPGTGPEYFSEVRPDLVLAHVTDLLAYVPVASG